MSLALSLNQRALLNALRENFKNDYPQASLNIDLVCSLFEQIIASPLELQRQKYEQLLHKNKNLTPALEFGQRRLKKYTDASPITEELIIQEPLHCSTPEQSLTDYDHLISNRHVLLDNKRVEFRKGTYLGDGKVRVFQRYEPNPRLFELSKSIWVAEKTPEEQYVWRARVMADKDDVYKLLKFLAAPLSPNVSKFPFQSIHINAGCHGIEGKGAYELAKPKLSDQRVYAESLDNIYFLKRNEERLFSPIQLEDISMSRTGTLNPSIYPYQADHIIDTLCEGARYKVEGNGLSRSLMFLYEERQMAEQVQRVNAARPKAVKVPLMAFGKDDWERYFGEVEDVPLPPNMEEILQGPCPIWEGKRVGETHMLTLIPQSVDGRLLTLDYLKKLIKKPKGGGLAMKYKYYPDYLAESFGNQTIEQSYWALMTKNVLPDSRGKTSEGQYSIVEGLKKRTGINYELPPILGATASILMHHARAGEMLYSNSYARCRETITHGFPLRVGCFSAVGLKFSYYHYDDNTGVAVFRKLC